MLRMVERDAKVKQAPERWQEERAQFQLVITFDRRVFESVVDGMLAHHSALTGQSRSHS